MAEESLHVEAVTPLVGVSYLYRVSEDFLGHAVSHHGPSKAPRAQDAPADKDVVPFCCSGHRRLGAELTYSRVPQTTEEEETWVREKIALALGRGAGATAPPPPSASVPLLLPPVPSTTQLGNPVLYVPSISICRARFDPAVHHTVHLES
jgi:hypothetical protein